MKKNHEKALAAILSTSSITEASKKAKLSETTLFRYLRDPEFQSAFRSARRDLVEAATGKIQQATTEAVETLTRNLHCEIPSAEIRAAQIILDAAYKGTELMDILERIEALENTQT